MISTITTPAQHRNRGAQNKRFQCPVHSIHLITVLYFGVYQHYEQDSGGSGFDDYGGDLELHRLDFSQDTDAAGTLMGKVKTRSVPPSLPLLPRVNRTSNSRKGLRCAEHVANTTSFTVPGPTVRLICFACFFTL